jgi:cobyrinic acid a,c-diamide synthase
MGLMSALHARGLVVQPFKAGPDFIDPAHHTRAAGRASRNLDGWMLTREQNEEVFARSAADADVAVIEGVMGLFDGRDGVSEDGSTAQIAKWLGVPVVLVVDAWALSRSAAAVVKGFAEFDRQLRVAGVIFNRVGGDVHLGWLSDAVTAAGPVEVLGGIPNDEHATLPERHLGLVMPDAAQTARWARRMGELVGEHVDLDRLLQITHRAPAAARSQRPPHEPVVRLAVARDDAFCFYYEDNLDLLRAAGAEIVEFSPLRDALPGRVDGVYVGGGYPELHARELAANTTLLRELREFAAAGGVVYGECGGLMYLGRGIEDAAGARHELCGVFDFWTKLTGSLSLDYADVTTTGACLFPHAATARGHLFHYSEMDGEPPSGRCYAVTPTYGEPSSEGFTTGNVLASWVHLHFGSNPAFADSLVAACRAAQPSLR